MSNNTKPSTPVASAPSAPAPGGTHGRGGLLARLVLAGLLIAAAVWVVQLSARDAEVEAMLGRAGVEGRLIARSNLREVDFRRALALDPHHAGAAYSLAGFLVDREMRNLAQGRLNVVDISRFDEAKGLLESSIEVVDRQPQVRLRLAEVAKMEARIHELRFQKAEAQEAYLATHGYLSEAMRLLPRPRAADNHARLYGDVLYFATRAGDHATAAMATREQDWLRNRWFLVDNQYTLDSARSFIAMGLYPQALRELRYELRRQPGSREVIEEFTRIAMEGNLERVAIATFNDLEREGRLVPQAAQSRERLLERILVLPEGASESS